MMQNKYMRYGFAIVLILGLVAIRFLENDIFYDPLIKYFKHTQHQLPPYDEIKLYTHLSFRYLINLLLTVGIVKLLFWKQTYVRFTIIFGLLFLIVLLPLYAYQLKHHFKFGEMIFFYNRRFLIQPMLLIILVPCFYYQEIKHKKV